MAFGGLVQGGDSAPMADINTTPLVDVMLVLLIIFMITTPLLTHAVRIDMPEASSTPNREEPETVSLALDADGRRYWNDEPIEDASLPALLALAAARSPQPELHLRADRETRYQTLAEVMSMAQRAGIRQIGFVTVPAVETGGTAPPRTAHTLPAGD
ncbi:MAG: biopolymer transporter ExbD [Zoogloeaceae bacterium]|nr:biopolymer transporter ExbD [Rhodocyclaceae bacterium]MCP5236454.1 biopolymer transporter ExbD [Zoogloeaceae bacterium]